MIDNPDSMREENGSSLLREERDIALRQEVERAHEGAWSRGEEGENPDSNSEAEDHIQPESYTSAVDRDPGSPTAERILDHARAIRIDIMDIDPSSMTANVGPFSLSGQDPSMEDDPNLPLLAINDNGRKKDPRRYEIWEQGTRFQSLRPKAIQALLTPFDEITPEKLGELTTILGDVSVALVERT